MTTGSTSADEHFMCEALRLAARIPQRPWPNPPVGAVVVRRDQVVGRGSHQGAGTRHAEMVALDEAEARRFLSNASVAADRLGRMIDDLLWTSRLETKQLGLRPQQFDLADKVSQVLSWFQPHAQGRRLVADLAGEGLLVWADPDRVEQVLFNLLCNAAKFTPDGGEIRVSARLENNQVAVSVQDTGEGIDAAELEKIFEDFYQVNGDASETRAGTGLGLPLSRKFIEMHGGRIGVESQVGEGTNFTVSLPACHERGRAAWKGKVKSWW